MLSSLKKLHIVLIKQAPLTWYDRLKSFLLNSGFKIGKVGTTLIIKHVNKDILIIDIYVDDILFGSINDDFYQEFSKTMLTEFEMSYMGELNYFLGLQIKQMKDEIFINQSQYANEFLKGFGIENLGNKRTPMGTTTFLDDMKIVRVLIKKYTEV